jgi:hypothetical protein
MTPNIRFRGFLMSGEKLQAIMNAVSERLDACPADRAKPPLSEFDAFLTFDETLQSLNKQYLDAKDQRRQAVREFGAGGMTDMAAILEDSAWCAVQTRYMELRDNRVALNRAQEIMNDARAKERREKDAEREKEQLAIYHMAQTAMMMKKAGCDDGVLFWMAVFILLQGQRQQQAMFREQASYSFNRLAA